MARYSVYMYIRKHCTFEAVYCPTIRHSRCPIDEIYACALIAYCRQHHVLPPAAVAITAALSAQADDNPVTRTPRLAR